jgi:hypothetical protein
VGQNVVFIGDWHNEWTLRPDVGALLGTRERNNIYRADVAPGHAMAAKDSYLRDGTR